MQMTLTQLCLSMKPEKKNESISYPTVICQHCLSPLYLLPLCTSLQVSSALKLYVCAVTGPTNLPDVCLVLISTLSFLFEPPIHPNSLRQMATDCKLSFAGGLFH